MNAWKISLGSIAAASVLGIAASSWADKSPADALREAPPAVQLAVIQLVGTNKIKEFEAEVEGGKTVYDLEYRTKDASYEADIDATGQVLTREVEVDLSIVPPAVIAAIKKAHADGQIGEASIVTAGDKMFYEFDVFAGKDKHEVQVSAGGSILSDTIEAPEANAKPGNPAEKPEKAEKHEDKD